MKRSVPKLASAVMKHFVCVLLQSAGRSVIHSADERRHSLQAAETDADLCRVMSAMRRWNLPFPIPDQRVDQVARLDREDVHGRGREQLVPGEVDRAPVVLAETGRERAVLLDGVAGEAVQARPLGRPVVRLAVALHRRLAELGVHVVERALLAGGRPTRPVQGQSARLGVQDARHLHHPRHAHAESRRLGVPCPGRPVGPRHRRGTAQAHGREHEHHKSCLPHPALLERRLCAARPPGPALQTKRQDPTSAVALGQWLYRFPASAERKTASRRWAAVRRRWWARGDR